MSAWPAATSAAAACANCWPWRRIPLRAAQLHPSTAAMDHEAGAYRQKDRGPPASTPIIWPLVMPGKRTEAVRIIDSMTSTAITAPVKMLRRVELAQGPRTSLSLHSSSRNTEALGSNTPASVCTALVRSPAARRESARARRRRRSARNRPRKSPWLRSACGAASACIDSTSPIA